MFLYTFVSICVDATPNGVPLQLSASCEYFERRDYCKRLASRTADARRRLPHRDPAIPKPRRPGTTGLHLEIELLADRACGWQATRTSDTLEPRDHRSDP